MNYVDWDAVDGFGVRVTWIVGAAVTLARSESRRDAIDAAKVLADGYEAFSSATRAAQAAVDARRCKYCGALDCKIYGHDCGCNAAGGVHARFLSRTP